jgi:hypothetical protein
MIKWRASRMSHEGMATSLARPVRHPAKFHCGNPARPTVIRRRGGMAPAEASTLARPMAGPFRLPGALRRADALACTGQRHSHASPPSNRVTRSRHYPRQKRTFTPSPMMHK